MVSHSIPHSVKTTFILYTEQWEALKKLNERQLGKILKCLYMQILGTLKESDVSDDIYVPFTFLKAQMNVDCRLTSPKAATRKWADFPRLFTENRQPTDTYILVPSVSSERRRYVPMGFVAPNVIASNLMLIVPNALLYRFGILESIVHMAWMRAVCGRLEMRYRYSNDIVYNNFPWLNPTEAQKAKIEQTAQVILDARKLYPKSSLIDMYDELFMPTELRKAHQRNDRAVMDAYGFDVKTMSESKCVAELFELYQESTK